MVKYTKRHSKKKQLMSSVTIKYFGLITEKTGKTEEKFNFEWSKTLHEIQNELIEKYPSLKHIQYTIAYNQIIRTTNCMVEQDSEIDLMPPFSGG